METTDFRATGTTQKTETTKKYPTLHRTLPMCYKMAASTELFLNTGGSVEIRLLYIKHIFSRDYKNKFVRLNCWKNW